MTKRSYTKQYDPPLIVKKGDRVLILKAEEEQKWLGWYFCKLVDATGMASEGWISKDYLDFDNTDKSQATLKENYSAQELEVKERETVIPLDESCGWFWCMKSSGEEGWIPSEVFEPYSSL